MPHNKSSRRFVNRSGFLKVTGLIGAASILPACSRSRQEEPTVNPTSVTEQNPTQAITSAPAEIVTQIPGSKQAVRIAHITDIHIPEDGTGQKEFSKVLSNLLSLQPAVDFVLNTGDSIMDALHSSKDTAKAEWDAFQSVLKSDYPIPVYHAIGNHDVWGWGLPEEERAKQQHDPAFGKGLVLERLGLSNRYYAFDMGGWHFIVLDDTQPYEKSSDNPYTGKLDDEQYEWLVGELESTAAATPICIASHIPIFGACSLLDSDESSGNWVMPGAWQHIDGRRLIALFWKHRNIRLCISGHTHQVEDLRYHGVKYLNDGAVCGNWWNGAYHDFPPAYALVNLYQDGSSDCEIITY